MDTQSRRGVSLTLVAAAMFAAAAVVAADTFSVLSPLRIAQLRSVGVAVVLMAMYGWRNRAEARPLQRALVALGVVLAVVTGSFYLAIDRLGVGPGATIQFVGPFLILLWLRVVARRTFPGWLWAAAAVALVGVSWLTGAWTITAWGGDLDLVGLAAAALAAFAFAAYFLVGEWLADRIRPQVAVAYGFFWSALIWLVALPPAPIPKIDLTIWLQLAWIIVLGSIVPFTIELVALRHADAGRVGVAAMAEPVIAAGLAWLFLGQELTTLQVLGGLLVVISVASVRWVISAGEERHLPELID